MHQGRDEHEEEQKQEQIIPFQQQLRDGRGEQQTPSSDRRRTIQQPPVPQPGMIDRFPAGATSCWQDRPGRIDRGGINAAGARSTVLAGYQIEEYMWLRGAP